MTLKPHFMPRNPGYDPWEPSSIRREVPLISALTFSSKSPFPYDNWSRDVVRPFQIIVFPGYVPDRSNAALNDADRAWFLREFSKPTIIWDGFCPIALFEVIYEVFGQSPLKGFMKVRNLEQKTWVHDPRDPRLLASRPAKPPVLSTQGGDLFAYKKAQRQYRIAVKQWARSCAVQDNGGYQAQMEWRKTAQMYAAVLDPIHEHHNDSIKRRQMAEAKWRSNWTSPIVDKTAYVSPVLTAEVELDRRAVPSSIPVSPSKPALQAAPSQDVLEAKARESFKRRIFGW